MAIPVSIQAIDWGVFRDEFILLAALAAMLVTDLVRPRGRPSPAGFILLAGAILALAAGLASPMPDAVLWNGAYLVDPFSRFFKALFLLALVLAVLAGLGSMRDNPYAGEFFLLLGSSATGMMLLVGAGDMVSLFISLELTSISLYLAAALARAKTPSCEAGLKYLLMGAFSTALFLFGLSFLYGLSGSTRLSDVGAALSGGGALPLFALLFVIAGVGFKIAAVPFHMWAPDVYEGAPTPMVAFASVASKAAGFAVLIRLVMVAMRGMEPAWGMVLALMAALTMALGSLAAIPQTNIKRLLAYSSIAQAGYVLIGFVAGTPRGVSSVMFYLLVYVFSNLGAFVSVIIVSLHSGNDEISSYAGLARRSPLLALSLMVSLLSLAGIPPLGGFVGKLYLFAAAMEMSWKYLWLVIIGVALSIVSLYYYLLVIRQMYIEAPTSAEPIRVGPGAAAALAACIAGMLVTGILPAGFLDPAMAAARVLLAR